MRPVVLISGTPYQGRPEGEVAIEFLAKQGYPTRLFDSSKVVNCFRTVLPRHPLHLGAWPRPTYHPNSWWTDEHSRTLFYSEWEKILGHRSDGLSVGSRRTAVRKLTGL